MCNPTAVRYAFASMRMSPPLLMVRLRASARVAAWVLLVFLLKVGMVAACTVDEMQDNTWGVASTEMMATNAAMSTDNPDGDAPSSVLSHVAGGCLDCHCHHAAALPPVMVTLAGPPAMTRRVLPSIAMPIGVVRNELCPPIL